MCPCAMLFFKNLKGKNSSSRAVPSHHTIQYGAIAFFRHPETCFYGDEMRFGATFLNFQFVLKTIRADIAFSFRKTN